VCALVASSVAGGCSTFYNAQQTYLAPNVNVSKVENSDLDVSRIYILPLSQQAQVY
jgi:hypothetical protein